ncbi:MAG: putative transporter ATP-binding protein [Phycisphaerales bacterium]|nr:putative transporter ATP-binding protein [Phycisphaerales bacterium]
MSSTRARSPQSEAPPLPAAAAVPPVPAAAPVLRTPAAVSALPSIEHVGNAYLLRWMFRFLRPVKWIVFFNCLYIALWVGAEALTTKQTARVVNEIQNLGTGPGIGNGLGFWHWVAPSRIGLRAVFAGLLGRQVDFRFQIIGLMLIVAAYVSFRYLRVVAGTKMSMNMVYYIREAVYDKLQRVGFGFHDAVSSGQLINRALSDLQNVRAFVETAVNQSLEIGLTVGAYIFLLITVSKSIALLSLVPLPLWTYYILRFSKTVQPAAKAVMEAEDRNVSIITENIAGVHVVKAFASERQEIEKYHANCDMFLTRVLKRIRLFADFTPIIRMIAMGSNLSLFLVAGLLMVNGHFLAGDFMILGQAMGAILTRLQAVATINEQYQNAIVSGRRLYEVLFAPSTVPEKQGGLALPPGKGAVKFENVTFGYDPLKPVLRDISFEVPGGSIVAIVGPTGAGKSTLVNLISRFYDPQRGRISIDGIDLRDASLASVRTQVSFVFQETYLFSDTVAGNIAYGRPHISEGDIEAASRLAQAHEFIETLSHGYQTILGERGSSLSGGQRQRLAIARAILTNPRVLILDDATAAVDPETEDLIRRGMRVVMLGRTTFVIAHRISTVKRADVVLVVENGRITQIGTHDELMARDGHYREIAAVQLYGDDGREPKGETEEESEHPSHMHRLRDPNVAKVAVPEAQTADGESA